MVQLRSDNEWLKWGRQRSAIAHVLRRPMTPSEIWRAAKAITPRIQLRTVCIMLRQMEQRNLITCSHPNKITGKVYYWSTARWPVSFAVNWPRYASVMRGRNRQLVLLELARRDRQSASRIRRTVNERHPVSLNSVIRTLKDLDAFRLIKGAGQEEKPGQKLYQLTTTGRHMAEMLAVQWRISRPRHRARQGQ